MQVMRRVEDWIEGEMQHSPRPRRSRDRRRGSTMRRPPTRARDAARAAVPRRAAPRGAGPAPPRAARRARGALPVPPRAPAHDRHHRRRARPVARRAPRGPRSREIEAFLREKERWILKRLDESRRQARPPFLWQEGERLPYLGSDDRARARSGRARRVARRRPAASARAAPSARGRSCAAPCSAG